MAINGKIKAVMNIQGKKPYEAAEYFGISAQAMRNKLSRDSFSAADLVKFADFLGCELAFTIDEKQKIILDKTDIERSAEHE